jgi:hypothetical protein
MEKTREEQAMKLIDSIVAACAKLQEGVDPRFLEELIDIDEKIWIIAEGEDDDNS